MTVQIRQRHHVGLFGSLNDGAALPTLEPHELPVSRNVEHEGDGAISKRPGRAVHAALCAADEPFCEPVVESVTDDDGTLVEGKYWVRVTYSTAAGETDDLYSSDPADPGPAEAYVIVGPGENAISVSVPFHMRLAQVLTHTMFQAGPEGGRPCDTGRRGWTNGIDSPCPGGTVPCNNDVPVLDDDLLPNEGVTFFTITPSPVAVCDEDIFEGWLVYSRSPRIQDETHLGINCDAAEPLYHRIEPLGTIRQYDAATGTFVMNGAVEFGLEDCLDENTVDIMMPDRCGLPIRHFNVYLSRDGVNFFYVTSGVSGFDPVVMTAYDEDAVRAPSTRIDRTAPTLTAVEVKDVILGRCGEHVVDTGMEAGLYLVRYTWVTADPQYVHDPGFETAAELLDISKDRPPHRARQETWPSCPAFVAIDEGQGIQVDVPTLPDGVETWSLYTERIEPFGRLTMDGGFFQSDIDLPGFDYEAPNAWYFPDIDVDPFGAAAMAAKLTIGSLPPLDTPPANSAAADSTYESFATTTNHNCAAGENPFDDSARGFRPAFQDVIEYEDSAGDPVFLFASSRDASDVNRMDFNFWHDQIAGTSAATHAVIHLRVRVREGYATGFTPANDTGTYFQVYDYNAGAFILLDSAFPCDGEFHDYAYTVTDLSDLTGTFGGESYFSFSFYAEDSVGFDIDFVALDLVTQPAVECSYVLLLEPFRGVYANQTAGGSPEDFGAWYSGDPDLNDAQVEAIVTVPWLDDTHPLNARNQPDGCEEYGAITDNPVVLHHTSGYVNIGSFAAPGGTILLPNTPANTPCIQYGTTVDGFEVRRASDGFVYTSGVDYTFDRYTGILTDVLIGVGVPLEAQYVLPLLVAGQNPTLPIPAGQRGWLPAYEDICGSVRLIGCYDTYAYLFGSTRDTVSNNRQHWWFRLEDADLAGLTAPTKMVVEITYRLRPGGGTYDPLVDASRKIRVWDEGAFTATGIVATSWIDLEEGLVSTVNAETGGFVTRRWAIPWDPDIRLTFTDGVDGPATGLPSPREYVIVDMAAWDFNGFDVHDIRVELWPDLTAPLVSVHELLQVERLVDTTYTLQNPLVERPRLGDPDIVETAMGPWVQLYQNTTPQWPTVCAPIPITGDDGVEDQLVHNFVGCADSVFRDKYDGTLERIFHVEGRFWNKSVRYDWRFTNYLWRTFFCNPGYVPWNLRFDGRQTFAMGLPWPGNCWEEVCDGSGNYVPPGANDPDPTGLQEACATVGEQPLGEVTDYTGLGPYADDEVPPDGVVCWDVEYYVVWKRVLRTVGRSYVVRSRPRLLTAPYTICGSDEVNPILRIEFETCPEAQVTHLEIYRNQRDTAQYLLVEEIELNGSVERACDSSDPEFEDGPSGRLRLAFEDEIPVTDEDLLIPAEFETGRPPAATTMLFHRGRVWFVQQQDRELIAFTNVTSPSGAINPEGFYVNHVIDPPMRNASAITALSPYHSALLAHSDNGIVGVTGISDDLNSQSGLQANALATDAGAIGPDAWVNVDNIQYLMTRKGPAVLVGDELAYLANYVEGSLETANLRTEVAYNSRLVHYRSRGRSQVWFTYAEGAFGEFTRCWVFDEEVGGPESRAQIWKTFSQMPVHGLCLSEDGEGEEYVFMGGHRGRLYRHDRGQTDAGLFIEFEVHTKPFDEGEYGRSIQPRWAYWHTTGDHGDVFNVDVRKDYERVNVNLDDIRIPLGGGAGVYWNEHWWNPFDDTKWGEEDVRPFIEQRMSMGQFFRQLQFVLSQSVERWPPGHKRAATFGCSGYDFFFRLLGPRPASGPR